MNCIFPDQLSEKMSVDRVNTISNRAVVRLQGIVMGLAETKKPALKHRFFATKLTQTKLRP